MSSIVGIFEFHRGTPDPQALRVPGVSASGDLEYATIITNWTRPNESIRPIQGTYNDQTKEIKFNDASEPGDVFFTTFYQGSVIPAPPGEMYGMAGTFHEQTITLRPTFSVTTLQGVWYAIWKNDIIV